MNEGRDLEDRLSTPEATYPYGIRLKAENETETDVLRRFFHGGTKPSSLAPLGKGKDELDLTFQDLVDFTPPWEDPREVRKPRIPCIRALSEQSPINGPKQKEEGP